MIHPEPKRMPLPWRKSRSAGLTTLKGWERRLAAARFLCAVRANSADELPCASKILSTLARRAYRRPVTDEDIQALLNFYKVGRKEGGFEAGIGMALQGMLVSPEFLFRIEHDPANCGGGQPRIASAISNWPPVCRFFSGAAYPTISFWIWPRAGKLKDPAVLEQQVRRMLADSRSKALVSNFVGQWLYLRNMRAVHPDQDAFPDFDENLREAFEQETELFFESNLREDRSVLDLLNANYTFVNERLARFYGIPNIYGSHFRRVIVGTVMTSGGDCWARAAS